MTSADCKTLPLSRGCCVRHYQRQSLCVFWCDRLLHLDQRHELDKNRQDVDILKAVEPCELVRDRRISLLRHDERDVIHPLGFDSENDLRELDLLFLAVLVRLSGVVLVPLEHREQIVNLDKKVKVRMNGRTLYAGKIFRSEETMKETISRRGDPAYCFPAKLDLVLTEE